jgi:hypothetical protein
LCVLRTQITDANKFAKFLSVKTLAYTLRLLGASLIKKDAYMLLDGAFLLVYFIGARSDINRRVATSTTTLSVANYKISCSAELISTAYQP